MDVSAQNNPNNNEYCDSPNMLIAVMQLIIRHKSIVIPMSVKNSNFDLFTICPAVFLFKIKNIPHLEKKA